jgi:hypothetical protein
MNNVQYHRHKRLGLVCFPTDIILFLSVSESIYTIIISNSHPKFLCCSSGTILCPGCRKRILRIEFETLTSLCTKNLVFPVARPRSSEGNRRFGAINFRETYSSTLTMEAIRSSEASGCFRNTRRHSNTSYFS